MKVALQKPAHIHNKHTPHTPNSIPYNNKNNKNNITLTIFEFISMKKKTNNNSQGNIRNSNVIFFILNSNNKNIFIFIQQTATTEIFIRIFEFHVYHDELKKRPNPLNQLPKRTFKKSEVNNKRGLSLKIKKNKTKYLFS